MGTHYFPCRAVDFLAFSISLYSRFALTSYFKIKIKTYLLLRHHTPIPDLNNLPPPASSLLRQGLIKFQVACAQRWNRGSGGCWRRCPPSEKPAERQQSYADCWCRGMSLSAAAATSFNWIMSRRRRLARCTKRSGPTANHVYSRPPHHGPSPGLHGGGGWDRAMQHHQLGGDLRVEGGQPCPLDGYGLLTATLPSICLWSSPSAPARKWLESIVTLSTSALTLYRGQYQGGLSAATTAAPLPRQP